VKQIGAKPALLAVTVFALSCAECDGGVGVAHTNFGRPASQASAAGTAQRKRGLVGGGVASRKAHARATSKTVARRQLAVKQGQTVRSVPNQQAARGKRPHRTASDVTSSRRQVAMRGLASFYSEDQETASGERFDRHKLSAAHPSLPFGTRLRVTNVGNGRSVTVRVNDRGPFVDGRIIDVTSAAAEVLGMLDAGVIKVTLDVVR
jgi:rare lipoprotein A